MVPDQNSLNRCHQPKTAKAVLHGEQLSSILRILKQADQILRRASPMQVIPLEDKLNPTNIGDIHLPFSIGYQVGGGGLKPWRSQQSSAC